MRGIVQTLVLLEFRVAEVEKVVTVRLVRMMGTDDKGH